MMQSVSRVRKFGAKVDRRGRKSRCRRSADASKYALTGGRSNTDAIDNSAGVNCSDVEVNIKIALAAAMRSGKLKRPARDKLLVSMTDDVSELVLRNNYLQPLALSLSERQGLTELPYQARFMAELESAQAAGSQGRVSAVGRSCLMIVRNQDSR